MLRPYIAVIQDSFRAAFSSRVLYIVLALIAVILLVLAPFHSRETLEWKFSDPQTDFTNPDRLAKRLIDDGKSGKRKSIAHIWNQLSPDFQEALEKQVSEPDDTEYRGGPPPGFRKRKQFTNEFNALMEQTSLYDEQAFAGKRLNEETRELIDKGDQRSSIEDLRLNRLLLSTALRRDMAMPSKTQLDFYYFNWQWSALTTTQSQTSFANEVKSSLPTYFDKFIMSIGIFIAILITASIIPEMLESGSLNLFLSKPVNRWALLLAKYVGGCVFIFLSASLLFVGLWFWLGIQLSIWDRAILISIPTYVLVFAMYYAVSVLAGIWFRSPILSITCALLFWAACWAIGSVNAWLDYSHYNTSARQLLVSGEDVMMVDYLQRHSVWDAADEAWRNPSKRDKDERENGLVFAAFFDRLDQFPDMPGPAVNQLDQEFLFADSSLANAFTKQELAISGSPTENGEASKDRGILPNGTIEFVHSQTLGTLAINDAGTVFRQLKVETDASDDEEETEAESDNKKSLASGIADRLSGLLPIAATTGEYQKISATNQFEIPNSRALALDPKTNFLYMYSDGKLNALKLDEAGNYVDAGAVELGDHENNSMTAFVNCGGSHIFVMLGNGQFFQLDSSNLSIEHSINMGNRAAIRCMSASPDGRFCAATFRDGTLWIYDADQQKTYDGISLLGTDFMACDFDNSNRLWVGDRFRSVYGYDLESGENIIAYEPAADWMTNGYRLLVRPLYRAFPKPGEFYKLISHLSTSSSTRDDLDVDLTQLPHIDNPWAPLKSGIIFTVCILAIACFVFQRMDF
ncbi:MAG: ABC transporter permease subunit [Pirellulaceae bacterium]|nr:ABC transporter permease subunit [Pirellulaceae bacterium]